MLFITVLYISKSYGFSLNECDMCWHCEYMLARTLNILCRGRNAIDPFFS